MFLEELYNIFTLLLSINVQKVFISEYSFSEGNLDVWFVFTPRIL